MSWSGWEGFGGELTSGPGVCSWATGRLDVFACGVDRTLYHLAYDGGWGGWEALGGGQLTSDPAAVSWGPGRIDVFGRGTDNALYHRYYDGGWSGWEGLGGELTSGPGVCSWATGRLDVFACGVDRTLYHLAYDGGWGGWEALGGGQLTSDPAAVSWGPGRIDVFGRGTDNALYHRYYDGGWSGWEGFGGELTSGPGVCSWALGRLDVFVCGIDRAVHHRAYDGGWGGWEALGGGQLTSDPAAVSWGPGRIDVFGRGTDNALYHRYYDGATAPVSARPSDYFFTGDNAKNPAHIAARDVEVRGWLIEAPSFNAPEDFHYNIVLDADFIAAMYGPGGSSTALAGVILPGHPVGPGLPMQDRAIDGASRGITANSFALPGFCGSPLTLVVELNAWHRDQRGDPPAGWVEHDGSWWPFPPLNPDNGAADLQAGDYVAITGTLWVDGAHVGGWLCETFGGVFCSNTAGQPDKEQLSCWTWGGIPPDPDGGWPDERVLWPHGGWLEIHPCDDIRRLPSPRRDTTVAGVVLCAPSELADATRERNYTILPPVQPSRPESYFVAREVTELIDGRFTDMRTVERHSVATARGFANVSVRVRSTGKLTGRGKEGRFKAVYVVRWDEQSEAPECPTLRSTISQHRDTISALRGGLEGLSPKNPGDRRIIRDTENEITALEREIDVLRQRAADLGCGSV